MFPSHPLEKVSTRSLIPLLIALLLGTVLLSRLFLDWGVLLVHPEAPYGILDFEFIWTVDGFHRVVGPWNEAARQMAVQITCTDFAYIILYSACLATACVLLARRARTIGRFSVERFGLCSAWFAWIAGGCDVIENGAALILLLTRPLNPWPFVMSLFATIKFGLLLVIVAYIVFAAIGLLLMPGKKSAEVLGVPEGKVIQ